MSIWHRSIILVIIYVAIIISIIIGLGIQKPNSEESVNCQEIERHDSFYQDNGQGYLVKNCRINDEGGFK